VAENTQEYIVETYELTKVFRDFWRRPKVQAVNSLNLKINKGEVFGMLGPNGSGKSTTIKMLLGLLFPTSGKVAVFGRPVRDIRVKSRIGYLPEETNLYRFLNAEETLDFYGKLFNFTSKERKWRIDNLLDLVGLSSERHRPLSEYSKGMSRRIGLAQALVNDPDLIILDEPTAGLDPIGRREVKNLIIELKNRGKTTLLSSHLLAEVEEVCDRIGILYGGKMLAEGEVGELLTRSDLTQIMVPGLDEKTAGKVVEFISNAHPDKKVEVHNSRQTLETFFLDIVGQAREEKVTSAGAAAGGAAETLMVASQGPGPGRKKKNVLSELTKKEDATGPGPSQLPEQVAEIRAVSEQKKSVLNKLTKEQQRPVTESHETAEARQQELASDKKRKRVIDGLKRKDKDSAH
jgi:ABC-2 type transport system ATP-binding protein